MTTHIRPLLTFPLKQGFGESADGLLGEAMSFSEIPLPCQTSEGVLGNKKVQKYDNGLHSSPQNNVNRRVSASPGVERKGKIVTEQRLPRMLPSVAILTRWVGVRRHQPCPRPARRALRPPVHGGGAGCE